MIPQCRGEESSLHLKDSMGPARARKSRKLAVALRAAGHEVIETREPGGTATERRFAESCWIRDLPGWILWRRWH